MQNPATDPRLGMFCAEGEAPPGAEKKHDGGHSSNANANGPHDGRGSGGSGGSGGSDAAKEQAFVLRLSMTAHSCKLDAFVNEPQCKARADPSPTALALPLALAFALSSLTRTRTEPEPEPEPEPGEGSRGGHQEGEGPRAETGAGPSAGSLAPDRW